MWWSDLFFVPHDYVIRTASIGGEDVFDVSRCLHRLSPECQHALLPSRLKPWASEAVTPAPEAQADSERA